MWNNASVNDVTAQRTICQETIEFTALPRQNGLKDTGRRPIITSG